MKRTLIAALMFGCASVAHAQQPPIPTPLDRDMLSRVLACVITRYGQEQRADCPPQSDAQRELPTSQRYSRRALKIDHPLDDPSLDECYRPMRGIETAYCAPTQALPNQHRRYNGSEWLQD